MWGMYEWDLQVKKAIRAASYIHLKTTSSHTETAQYLFEELPERRLKSSGNGKLVTVMGLPRLGVRLFETRLEGFINGSCT